MVAFNSSGLCNGQSYGYVANSTFDWGGTHIAPSATANTKGSWVQLTSSTAADMVVAEITISGSASNAWQIGSIDIGLGAAGSEVIVIHDLIVPIGGQFGNVSHVIQIPLEIPKGTRISARSQANAASADGNGMQVSVNGYEGDFLYIGSAGVDALGFNSSTTAGTTITPGNAAKGSYSQIVASTSVDYVGIFAVWDGTASVHRDPLNVDIAIGASGSEKIIYPDIFMYQIGWAITPFIPINIPAGTRIAARAADLNFGALTFDLTVYGVYA